jgi:hypothetical protein
MKKFKEMIGKMIDKIGFVNVWLSPEQISLGAFIYKTAGKKFKIKLPQIIPGKIHKIRIKIKNGNELSDKIIRLKYNKGATSNSTCWINKDYLKQGYKTSVRIGKRVVKFELDENAHSLYKQKLNSVGKYPKIDLFSIFRKKYRGDVVVSFRDYQSEFAIKTPAYDDLSSDEIHNEKFGRDKINSLLKDYSYVIDAKKSLKNKINPDELVKRFNNQGVKGVFKLIKKHFLRGVKVKFSVNPILAEPGRCKSVLKTTYSYGSYSSVPSISKEYIGFHVEINPSYIHNPFVAAAVISHELCHVFNNYHLGKSYGFGYSFSSFSQFRDEYLKSDEEKLVDILTIVNGLGEYQLRACTYGYILGYFSPKVFIRLNDYLNTYTK